MRHNIKSYSNDDLKVALQSPYQPEEDKIKIEAEMMKREFDMVTLFKELAL